MTLHTQIITEPKTHLTLYFTSFLFCLWNVCVVAQSLRWWFTCTRRTMRWLFECLGQLEEGWRGEGWIVWRMWRIEVGETWGYQRWLRCEVDDFDVGCLAPVNGLSVERQMVKVGESAWFLYSFVIIWKVAASSALQFFGIATILPLHTHIQCTLYISRAERWLATGCIINLHSLSSLFVLHTSTLLAASWFALLLANLIPLSLSLSLSLFLFLHLLHLGICIFTPSLLHLYSISTCILYAHNCSSHSYL